jgi:hypothetical protein
MKNMKNTKNTQNTQNTRISYINIEREQKVVHVDSSQEK